MDEIAVDDVVLCNGDATIAENGLGLSRPRGPMKVHKIMESAVGGVAWALLKVPGNPYVTATWPVSQMTKVE